MKKIILALVVAGSAICCSGRADESAREEIALYPGQIDVSSVPGAEISEYLTGVNLLYCFEPDMLWTGKEGKRIRGILEKMKCGILRYPGGAITEAWHWDQPNGVYYKDIWDPDYNPSQNADPSAFMDLEEYMDVVKAIGAEPLVGINTCSGPLYRNHQASVDKARALVKHCMEKGYGVKYYFIGNEPYHPNAKIRRTPEEYAKEVNCYAQLIRSLDPSAKIVANWHPNVRHHQFSTLLKLAGKNIDYMDVHWYWNWGAVTWKNWLNDVPMSPASPWNKEPVSYVDDIAYFNRLKEKYGCPQIRLCSLEWNLAPDSGDGPFPDEYQAALMQSEMLMQFMEGGLSMAAFWPLSYPPSDKTIYMLSSNDNYRERNTTRIFAMLSPMLGGRLLETGTSDKLLYAVAARTKEGKDCVCILNKSMTIRTCTLRGFDASLPYSARCYKESDKKGKAEFVELSVEADDASSLRLDLPPYSLTFVQSR